MLLNQDYRKLGHTEQLIFDILELENRSIAKREWLNQFVKDEAEKFNNTNLFPSLDLGLEYGEVLYEYVDCIEEQKKTAMELHMEYHFPLQTYVRVDEHSLLLLQQQQNGQKKEIVAFVKTSSLDEA